MHGKTMSLRESAAVVAALVRGAAASRFEHPYERVEALKGWEWLGESRFTMSGSSPRAEDHTWRYNSAIAETF